MLLSLTPSPDSGEMGSVTVTRRVRFGVLENEGEPWVWKEWTQEGVLVCQLQRCLWSLQKSSPNSSEQLGHLRQPQVIVSSVSGISASVDIGPFLTPKILKEK